MEKRVAKRTKEDKEDMVEYQKRMSKLKGPLTQKQSEEIKKSIRKPRGVIEETRDSIERQISRRKK